VTERGRRKPRRQKPEADALAPPLGEVERRKRGKALLRRYLLAGVAPEEARDAVMRHPDLAGNPPSPRTLQEWTRQLRAAPGGDLVDDDVRALVGHPLEDHRKAQLAAIAGRIEKVNLIRDGLLEELNDCEDAERRAEIRRELREEDKRLHAAWEQHAKVTGIDSMPIEAHLAEAEARTRLVQALASHAREFEIYELRAVIDAFQIEVGRRESMAAEHRRALTLRETAAEIGLLGDGAAS